MNNPTKPLDGDPALNDIPDHQNKQQRLDLLRAQRAYYRRAKFLQAVLLVCALALPWAGSFWGTDDQQVRPLLALLSVALLLLDIGVATRLQRDWIKTAARIQEQFDTEVLGLAWNQFVVGSKVDPECIRSVTRLSMTAEQRKDLMGWYEQCVGSIPLALGRLVCQRTNISYDMRVRKGYAWGCLTVALVLFLICLVHGIHEGLSLSAHILKVVVPFVPLAAFVLREHRKQAEAVEALTTLKAEVEKLWAKALREPWSVELQQDSRNLQDAIFRNRTSNPLVYDWVYWLSRKFNEDAARHAAETLVAEAKAGLAGVR